MPSYAQNKKARFEYDILDTFEAGLQLSGQEVKSVRAGQMRLSGAYISVLGGEAFLKGAHIPKYRYAGHLLEYDPLRPRKVLLAKKEIAQLSEKSQERGLTIVPLSVYSKGRYIKLSIGIARGKKEYDKREKIKKRDIEKDLRREMKGRY